MFKYDKKLVYLTVFAVFVVFMGFGISHGLIKNLNCSEITNFCGVCHNLTVGKSQHNPLEFSKTIDGTKRNLSIETNNLSSNYGDTITVTVKLIDKITSQPVVNKTVFLQNDDLPQGEGKTNSLGIVKFTYVPECGSLKPDIYQFKVISPEDSQYEYNQSYLTVNVNKIDATVSVDDIKCDRGIKCNITAVFKNKTKVPVCTPIYGQLVDFYCNGAKIGSDVTSFNGTATLTFTPNESGNFKILVKSEAGNEYYNPSNTTANLVVDKYRTILKMLSVRGKPGDEVLLTAYLTDAVTGKVIPNMKIHFTGIMQDHLGISFTNGMGCARFGYAVPNVKDGRYNVSSDFEGNDEYKHASINQLFIVDKGTLTEGYSIF